jgi:hypothetical protein
VGDFPTWEKHHMKTGKLSPAAITYKYCLTIYHGRKTCPYYHKQFASQHEIMLKKATRPKWLQDVVARGMMASAGW